jgi:hypothetical protein
MPSTHYASLLRGPRVSAAFDDEPRACDDGAAYSIATCRRSEPVGAENSARAPKVRHLQGGGVGLPTAPCPSTLVMP